MRALAAMVVVGCGSAPAPATTMTPNDPPVVVAAPPPAPAPIPPTPPPPPPATGTIEGVIVAGALTTADVTALLAPLAPQLAACLSTAGATTSELLLSIPDGVHPTLRNVWRGGAPIEPTPACLEPIFPADPAVTRDRRSTGVYVVVKATPPGTTAPVSPAPPDRRASFDAMFCLAFETSGADKLAVEHRMKTMQEWILNNVRHPAPYEVAGAVGDLNLAEIEGYLKRSIKAEGIKKCPLQNW